MQVNGYQFHRRAVISFQQLDADEQAQILKSLAGLFATPVEQWPDSAWQAKKLPNEPTYLVHLNNNLRAFVAVAEGQQPEVLDIVYQGRLDFYANSVANSEH